MGYGFGINALRRERRQKNFLLFLFLSPTEPERPSAQWIKKVSHFVSRREAFEGKGENSQDRFAIFPYRISCRGLRDAGRFRYSIRA